jgi:hypothetical protein
VTKPAAEATMPAAMETPALAGSENAPVPAGTSAGGKAGARVTAATQAPLDGC